MADRALSMKQYASLLGVCYTTFQSAMKAHPERFAPHFDIGNCRRWWESTVIEFHKKQETQEVGAGITTAETLCMQDTRR